MASFKKYPTIADGVTRKQRKRERRTIFLYNSQAFAEARRARVKARKVTTEKENV